MKAPNVDCIVGAITRDMASHALDSAAQEFVGLMLERMTYALESGQSIEDYAASVYALRAPLEDMFPPTKTTFVRGWFERPSPGEMGPLIASEHAERGTVHPSFTRCHSWSAGTLIAFLLADGRDYPNVSASDDAGPCPEWFFRLQVWHVFVRHTLLHDGIPTVQGLMASVGGDLVDFLPWRPLALDLFQIADNERDQWGHLVLPRPSRYDVEFRARVDAAEAARSARLAV